MRSTNRHLHLHTTGLCIHSTSSRGCLSTWSRVLIDRLIMHANAVVPAFISYYCHFTVHVCTVWCSTQYIEAGCSLHLRGREQELGRRAAHLRDTPPGETRHHRQPVGSTATTHLHQHRARSESVYFWNSLPEHIRQSTLRHVFKRSLKTFLLQQISHLAHWRQ